jgi:hypothetical protein
VRISGTIRLNEKIYCVRDKGQWENCPNGAGVDDLVDAIEKLHNAATVYVDGGRGSVEDLLANERPLVSIRGRMTIAVEANFA